MNNKKKCQKELSYNLSMLSAILKDLQLPSKDLNQLNEFLEKGKLNHLDNKIVGKLHKGKSTIYMSFGLYDNNTNYQIDMFDSYRNITRKMKISFINGYEIETLIIKDNEIIEHTIINFNKNQELIKSLFMVKSDVILSKNNKTKAVIIREQWFTGEFILTHIKDEYEHSNDNDMEEFIINSVNSDYFARLSKEEFDNYINTKFVKIKK